MTRLSRRRTIGLLAASIPTFGLASTVTAATSGSVTADDTTPGATTTHTVTVTVDGDAAGSSLNSFVVDYEAADVSDVGVEDVAAVGLDRGDDADGATTDVSVADDLSSVSASDDGTTLTLGFGGSYSLAAGDEVVLRVGDVVNPTSAGTTEVRLVVNQQSAAETTTASLTVSDSDDGEDGDDDDETSDCASVTFSDQTTAGDTVTVDSVTLPDGGFVVVHTPDHGTLGVSDFLAAGTHTDVTVTLDDPLSTDRRLQAMAHRDTNGNETYDHGRCAPDTDGHYTCDGDAVAAFAAIRVSDDC
jgi:hypothetical protein